MGGGQGEDLGAGAGLEQAADGAHEVFVEVDGDLGVGVADDDAVGAWRAYRAGVCDGAGWDGGAVAVGLGGDGDGYGGQQEGRGCGGQQAGALADAALVGGQQGGGLVPGGFGAAGGGVYGYAGDGGGYGFVCGVAGCGPAQQEGGENQQAQVAEDF